MSNIDKYSETIFEDIKHLTEEGIEFWYGRELQRVLEYTEWRNFYKVIDKAKIACDNSNQQVSDHFVDITKMVQLGSGAQREIEDIMLSRYTCYLIVQNSDPRKDFVALGQTYFAVKTRERELEEKFEELTEEEKRLAIRNELKNHNKSLAEAAQDAGVVTPKDYGIFQNRGYQGLYGGLGARDIQYQINPNNKKLPKFSPPGTKPSN